MSDSEGPEDVDHERFNHLSNRTYELERRIDSVDEKLSRLEGKFDQIRTDLRFVTLFVSVTLMLVFGITMDWWK